MIDKNTYEIRQDEDKTVYTSLDEISDDLPDHAPRFILLSYPLTMVRSIDPSYLYNTNILAGRRTTICTIRAHLLPPRHMQCRDQNALRRCQRVDA